MLSSFRPAVFLVLGLVLAACAAHSNPTISRGVSPAEVHRLLSVLADDSMQGRRTATEGAARAARFIASRLRAYGVHPAGDDGFYQNVPLVWTVGASGRRRLTLQTGAAIDTAAGQRPARGRNVVGIIPGEDPQRAGEYVVVAAHYDHLGIGRPVNGDSIYNGADDDASGVVAVLEVARALARQPAPRSVVILLATGEELGLLGTRWYVAHPVRPLDHTIAELEVEMIGRPDYAVGGPGRAWLTGYDRSTVGDMLRAADLPIVPDPRPDQHFFRRSDNIAFALRGIPAHTVSSFDLHGDYHRPSDELDRTDPRHMAGVIDAVIRAVRLLATGPAPTWHPGGQPTAH
ncbi:MAG: M20/M25/M40 family metallo-hydrolase [Gemmatimonadota bacterium]